MNVAIVSGCEWTPWFLMKSRGMTHGRLRVRKLMHIVNYGMPRVSPLRNGRG